MTKYIEHNYFYIIFEVGSKGYVLKETYLPYNSYKKEEEEYLKYSNLIDEKLHQGFTENEVLEELGYLNIYHIQTHKAKISIHNQDLWNVRIHGESQNGQNTMYQIQAIKKIKDFSSLSRYDPSRITFYLKSLKDKHNEDSQAALFLN